MTEITQKLLTEEMIPIAHINKINSGLLDKLKITIDGYNAQCFIAERLGSDKIVIIFEKEHPKYGDSFTNKYFQFKKPGEMIWGHEQKIMKIVTV